jgi:nitrite reductase/ring-hydroxylating ferredoxin subunit
MADFVKVANTNEIEPGQARRLTVEGKDIALFNVDGQFFALDNTCTHRGGPLVDLSSSVVRWGRRQKFLQDPHMLPQMV